MHNSVCDNNNKEGEKRFMKKRVQMIFALAIMFCVMSVSAINAKAAELGTSATNPIELNNGKWYTRKWTSENCFEDCYNKIELHTRGYITFYLERYTDAEGNVCTYNLELYDSAGNIIWTGDKSSKNDIFNKYYEHKIGLDAGIYYMNIESTIYVPYDAAPVDIDYRYVFKETNLYEKESNDDFKTATAISVDKEYSAVIEENVYDKDYYKIKLTKGKEYTITFDNYDSNVSYMFCNPGQEEEYFTNNKEYLEYGFYYGLESIKEDSLVWTFKATESGYHYICVTDWSDKDIPYSVKVTANKIPASKVTAKLKTSSYTYNGKTKTPTVTVKYGSKTLKKGTDYTVTYASGRKNVGKYKVTIKFKGNYVGSKTLYFKINPPKTTVKKVTGAKKSVKVSLTKKTTQVTGYQVQYSVSKKFTNAKTKTITSAKTTSTTIKSLKAKKRYYVRVRTYKTVKGVKYYSGWSTYKSAVTK